MWGEVHERRDGSKREEKVATILPRVRNEAGEGGGKDRGDLLDSADEEGKS